MQWDEFERACPDLAHEARARFEKDQLVMLGTLRRDGWPRISPCEVDFAAGHLFLGMMWRSPKALDLLRDPRITVHSVTVNREGTHGDIKLYGRVVDIPEPELREAFREAIKQRIDWAPTEPDYHLFSLDVERAGTLRFGGVKRVAAWDPELGLRRWTEAEPE
jgi:Pyridoxamine 5'-phosphate oxidase